MRRTAFYYGSRVNVISPWLALCPLHPDRLSNRVANKCSRYVRTNILPPEVIARVQEVGVQFAEAADAGECLLRVLSDTNINGRSIFLSGRKWAPRGYMDLDLEDYSDALVQEIQEDQMKAAPPAVGLFV